MVEIWWPFHFGSGTCNSVISLMNMEFQVFSVILKYLLLEM